MKKVHEIYSEDKATILEFRYDVTILAMNEERYEGYIKATVDIKGQAAVQVNIGYLYNVGRCRDVSKFLLNALLLWVSNLLRV